MKKDATFVLATRSTHKQREIQHILGESCRIITLDDAGVAESAAEDDIEAFETFRENALAKAHYFHTLTQMPTIADDSGISFDALNGAPGVRSKRFSGRTDIRGAALDRANNELAIAKLSAFQHDQRTAHYMCVAALVIHAADSAIAVGSCSGIFILDPHGNAGFGYDPHFFLPSEGKTFGELALSEKERFSHRARAFRALAPLLH